jgi:hypothetical protein
LDSSLGSDTLLPILKSSPIIFNNLLSNHLTFEKSTRQNTRANRNGDLFPRSSTLGMQLFLQSIASNIFVPEKVIDT